MTDEMRAREEAICKVAKVNDIGEVSDGFHTFNGLYEQRMILFAALVKAYKDKAWKSYRHEDGAYCFGGGWFIVGIDTPEGSYTYHYENKYWDMFDCVELPRAKHWDGHTEADAETRLMSLKPEPHWIPVTKDTLPQLNKVVVVCGDKGTWDVGRYRGYSEITGHENINLWNWKNNTLKSVYWWMYKEDALPEPTREVTE